jgi:murein DD-endopeptidase MepM/ murein hydrolase activator NlpD
MSASRGATAASLAALVALCAAHGPAAAEDFGYMPVGELVAGSGQGCVDSTVYAPGIRFPIEQAPAYANSQVWGHGGMNGPGGSQCDVENYSYPWWDNYCETRSWDMPLCPSGTGHQGQDIRPATCDNKMYWCVAVDDGTITNIGTYSVYLVTTDGTQHRYLHMDPDSVTVSVGDQVVRGQRIGLLSNAFGGTPTTIHLHYDIFQNLQGYGGVYVPPYTSLIAAYEELIAPPPDMGVPDLTVDTGAGDTGRPDVTVIADGPAADGAAGNGSDDGCACALGASPPVRSPLGPALLLLGLCLAIRRRARAPW